MEVLWVELNDPETTFEPLIEFFFQFHDPTTLNRQVSIHTRSQREQRMTEIKPLSSQSFMHSCLVALLCFWYPGQRRGDTVRIGHFL